MTETNWGSLAVFEQRLADEIRRNLPPPPPDSKIDPVAELGRINAIAHYVQAELALNQGVETAVADILASLAKNGVPYAATIRDALLLTPEALAEFERWEPTMEWALTAFTPASPGLPDATQGARGHVS